MEKLVGEFSVGLFFWQTLMFLILMFLLKKYAWKPILDAVNEREEKIQGALDSAKEAEEKMAQLTSSNENLLKEARIERDAILKEAKEAKNTIIAEAKGQATEVARKVTEDAKAQIQMEKVKAITELKTTVATLSIDIAEKILKGELSDKSKQESLVNNLIEDVNLN
jgi:F-type H+-transporting ATPase subunit b